MMLRHLFRRVPLVSVLLIGTISVSSGYSGQNPDYRAAAETITASRLQGYINYLAQPYFRGREAGSSQSQEVAEFLARRLELLKVAAAGAEGFFQPFYPGFRNVLGMMEGREPNAKEAVILLQAHYDHVGIGNPRTSRRLTGEIHPGADDNASGVAALMLIAEALRGLPSRPRHSILIAFWDAEEKGLLGSKHFAVSPTVKLDRIRVSLAVDMIGRLAAEGLHVYGTRSAAGLRSLVALENDQTDVPLDFSWKMPVNGDHYVFYTRGIPLLLWHTGEHEDYHTPSDTPDRINQAGLERIVRLMFQTLCRLDEMSALPSFRSDCLHETQQPEPHHRVAVERDDRWGARWQAQAAMGVVVTWVHKGTPAERALLQPGDRIVQFGGRSVQDAQQLQDMVQLASSPVTLLVQRAGEAELRHITTELAGEPLRLGITWQVDPAEPGVVVVSSVVPESPAHRGGLQVGDRILKAAGRRISDADFQSRIYSLDGSVQFAVERGGRSVTLQIRLPPRAKASAA